MAPSTDVLQQALIDSTCKIFNEEPDATSVNKVRRHVEEKLGLEEGFFAGSEWKQKSKDLIKEHVGKLLDGWVPEPEPEPEPNTKNGVKRQSSEAASPEPKRRKRASKNGKATKVEDSEAEESAEELVEGGKKSKVKKAAARRKSKKAESDSEEPNSSTSEKVEKTITARVRAPSSASKLEESESKQGDDTDDGVKPSTKDDETKPVIDEEEEYSDVIDEAPQPKRKKNDKKEPSKPSKSAAKPRSSAKAAPVHDDPDEAEIKKLQSQLMKCGIRKLWHVELKQYGNDARAKIRHLKKMLSEAGMDGRFSESKAREIRETRELLAEAEAAQEMNRLWGMDNGGRASRSKNQATTAKTKEDSDENMEEEVDDDEEDPSSSFAARRRRAQADLAFLGDSDSDSD